LSRPQLNAGMWSFPANYHFEPADAILVSSVVGSRLFATWRAGEADLPDWDEAKLDLACVERLQYSPAPVQ